MWVRNVDTGKWTTQIDQLSKDNYDSLKQDIQSIKLYSKCLSGSTYLMINEFENIYSTLDINKLGFYIRSGSGFGVLNTPNGPRIEINSSNYEEFYTKYLRENAFTIKNLFTTTRLINTEIDNYNYVDLATTEQITNLSQSFANLVIDETRAIEGHRILVKNQITRITLSVSVDAEKYFTENVPVSEYYLVESGPSDVTYYYYNKDNGIYLYTNKKLVKQVDLSEYDSSYKYSAVVKLGASNREKQFHLRRLKNGYYPIETENVEFSEKHNWVLRNRVDYNNVLDINYYDVLISEPTQVFSRTESFTYSIPRRVLSVGEFGVLVNNQDLLNPSATYSNSTIINSKYKVNLRSITESNDYYWVCGDEGTLLKIYKPNFEIERIDLKMFNKLNHVNFYNDLNGFVVGEFNRIFFTTDGGSNWTPIEFPEFESYSFNRVVYKNLNQVYLCGDSGVFVELNKDGNSWIGYKRLIYTQKGGDSWEQVDDFNDLLLTEWVTLDTFTFSNDSESSDFADSLSIKHFVTANRSYNTIQLKFDTPFRDNATFKSSEFYIGMQITNSYGFTFSTTFYGYNPQPFDTTQFAFYQKVGATNSSYDIDFPLSIDGNLLYDTYNIQLNVIYNYDGENNQIFNDYQSKFIDYTLTPKKADLLLLSTYDKVTVFDIDKKIYKGEYDFFHFDLQQTVGDILTFDRPKFANSDYLYFGSDKVYYLRLRDLINFANETDNIVTTTLSSPLDLYVNRLKADDKVYFVGNNSLLKTSIPLLYPNDFSQSVLDSLDPNFGDKYRSRLLFLDYDIGSKLNFFDDSGVYRLPNGCTFDESSLTSSGFFVEFESLPNQTSWVDYYKDAEKTFEYYTAMSDLRKVEFSSTFSFLNNNVNDFTFTNTQISTSLDDIVKFAPTIDISSSSEFFRDFNLDIITFSTDTTLSQYDVLTYKNLTIFKRDINDTTEVGDVLRLETDIVDSNLVVNKILYYFKSSSVGFNIEPSIPTTLPSGYEFEKYIICYNTFNQNIVNNLLKYTSVISIKNLNKYVSPSDFYQKFENHPVGIGYKATPSDSMVVITPRFNNKTAYYNLAINVNTPLDTYILNYTESFLRFGYSPNYNIMDMLSMIDSNIFVGTKKFTILPEYLNLPGNNANDFTDNNIFIDQNVYDSNKITFGKNLKFEWTSLLKWTFVDITLYNQSGVSKQNEKMLIIDKYYDESLDGYVIEFHRRLLKPPTGGPNPGIFSLDILSRNTLEQISGDLQALNNIQRGQMQKSVQDQNYFTDRQNEIKTRFTTDTYLKVLVSDFDIQQNVTALIYSDVDFQLCFNLLNVEKEIIYEFNTISRGIDVPFTDNICYSLTETLNGEITIGDLVYVELTGATGSSKTVNPQYQGFQTIVGITGSLVTTSHPFGMTPSMQDFGSITFLKKDAFLNYQPIDLFNVGQEKKPTRSVEILPENVEFVNNKFNLINIDTTKYKVIFVDGLSLQEVEEKFPWFLQAETSNAIIGRDDNGLVWYRGMWRCGRWFGGTWISGEWLGGDWYAGDWYAFNNKYNVLNVLVDKSRSDYRISKWYGGRWFGGTWHDGTWFSGRRYAGDWMKGIWYDGTWNDGTWNDGIFQGGVWIAGTWNTGKFNCDNKPSYWIDGKFISGDFENGIWYNGQFGNNNSQLSRFGTRSLLSRISIWHGGKWVNGEFHSFLNTNDVDGTNQISDVHKLSTWRTGLWMNGNFYGGVVYNIDFRNGTWHGGILEEIQLVGLDAIYPAQTATNIIYTNGIFKFNPGDEIYIIDDYRNGDLSLIGSNEKPGIYRVNKIVEDVSLNRTGLYLNYNLSNLGIDNQVGSATYSSIDLGLRLVSHFKYCTWKSGLWTNGVFDEGDFQSGMWYNGVFKGKWSN